MVSHVYPNGNSFRPRAQPKTLEFSGSLCFSHSPSPFSVYPESDRLSRPTSLLAYMEPPSAAPVPGQEPPRLSAWSRLPLIPRSALRPAARGGLLKRNQRDTPRSPSSKGSALLFPLHSLQIFRWLTPSFLLGLCSWHLLKEAFPDTLSKIIPRTLPPLLPLDFFPGHLSLPDITYLSVHQPHGNVTSPRAGSFSVCTQFCLQHLNNTCHIVSAQ